MRLAPAAIVNTLYGYDHVDDARAAIKDNRAPSSAGGRFAELSGGIIFCAGCGRRMAHYTTRAGARRCVYHYYKCPTVVSHGRDACPAKKTMISAPSIEAAVWEAVGAVVRETTRTDLLRVHFDRQADVLKRVADDLAAQQRLTERLSALDLKRSRYQDQQAEGLITTDELRAKLAGVEEERQALRGELHKISGAKDALASLAARRDALIGRARGGFFGALMESHGPEARRNAYVEMGLRVELDDEGNPIISGAFAELVSSSRRRCIGTRRWSARSGWPAPRSRTTGGTSRSTWTPAA